MKWRFSSKKKEKSGSALQAGRNYTGFQKVSKPFARGFVGWLSLEALRGREIGNGYSVPCSIGFAGSVQKEIQRTKPGQPAL